MGKLLIFVSYYTIINPLNKKERLHMDNQLNFEVVSDHELSEINGGFWQIIGAVVGAVALDAFQHSDQIVAGFKKTYKR